MPYVNPLDPATPAAGAFLSEGDDRIRELKLAIRERLLTIFQDVDANPLVFAAGIIATAALANSAVSTAKIADNAVTTLKILDDAVTNIKIAGGIDGSKIADGTIDTPELKDGSVTAAKLPDLTIVNAKIVDHTILGIKLAVVLRDLLPRVARVDYNLGAISPLNTNTSFDSADVALAGVALGDIVAIGYPAGAVGWDAPNKLITYAAYVSSADNVRLRVQNNTGGPVNVVGGVFRIMAIRRYSDWLA